MSKLKIVHSKNCWLSHEHWIKKIPPRSNLAESGNNIFHFNTSNQNFEDNSASVAFVKEHLEPDNAIAYSSDSEVLLNAVLLAKELNKDKYGCYLEFGFCTGRSINFIAALAYDKEVFGFDSGLGLSEDWRPGFEKGTYAFSEKDKMPFCPFDNTKLIIGEIAETLPLFIKELIIQKKKTIDFIFIDTDLYSSAKSIYENLAQYIIPDKTVLVLDQGYNYWQKTDKMRKDYWEQYEMRATKEFAKMMKYKINFKGYNRLHQQLIITFSKKIRHD